MGIRKQPFGYQISFGTIVASQPEAETVRWIFLRYAEGVSYAGLVEELAERGVPYDMDKPWNKNMVARILANKRYIGTGGYPPIITPEQFQRAAVKRPGTGVLADENTDVKLIRPLIRCADCGGRLQRKTNNMGYERWFCPECGVSSNLSSTPNLTAAIIPLLNRLIRNPEQVKVPGYPTNPVTSRRLQAELDRIMSMGTEEFDSAKAKTLTLALAAARFEELGSRDCETSRLRRFFESRTSITELDAVLLRETVAAILIGADGKVSLKLKNEQTIGRESSK